MIIRPHICLKCQHRLGRRSKPSKAQVAYLSSRIQGQPSDILPDGFDDGEHAPIKRPLKLSRRPLIGPKQVSKSPLGKLYGYSGQQLRENREKLSVGVLGESAEVIVLRDSKLSNYDNRRYEEDAEVPEGIDILARLDKERGLIGWEEVNRNINDFRPSPGDPPKTREAFFALLKELQNGFTVSQLAKYLQVEGQRKVVDHDSELEHKPDAAAIRISPWIPGISESDERLEIDPTKGYDLQSYTTKQRLVLRVLRECWKIELHYIEDGIGQIELELRPEDLDVLLCDDKSALKDLHSQYIAEEEEKLEIFKSNDAKRSRNAIRITSAQSKSSLVALAVEEKIKSIRRTQFSLKTLMSPPKEGEKSDIKKWLDQHFDDSVVNELARLTGTTIRKPSTDSLLISSIDSNTNGTSSSKLDLAQRLAITSGNFSKKEPGWVGCQDTPNAAQGTFVAYPLTAGLTWREKLHGWCRWVTPVSKDRNTVDYATEIPQEEKASGNTQEQTTLPLESDFRDNPNNPPSAIPSEGELSTREQRPSDVAFWSEQVSVQSSALLGTVLYAQSQLPSPTSQEGPSFANITRSFSTAVPGISRLLSTALTSNTKATESFVMHFTPNPFFSSSGDKSPIGAPALFAFPPIEMRFALDPGSKTIGLNQIHAVRATENSDLMLPGSSMDIRFQQKTTSRFYCNKKSLPLGIAKFVESSDLKSAIRTSLSLTAPPSLNIPIAAHLCTKDAFDLLGADRKDLETQDVEYIFAGFEVRRSIAMDFQGWRLVYTSVEGGPTGRSGGELRLRPTRIVESEDPELETEAAFLEAAFQLADTSNKPFERRWTREVKTYREEDGADAVRTFEHFAQRPSIHLEYRDDM